MANQLKLVATIAPANTAVEISTDNGVTWKAVAMSTNGSQQEGLLGNVAAGTYPAGTVKLRAVAFPSVVVSEPLARTVSGTAATVFDVVLFIGQSNDSGLSPRTGLNPQYFNVDSRVRSWDKTTATAATYSLGSIGGDGNPTGATDHAITKAIVPSYDNGIGPDVGFVKAWKDDAANASRLLLIFKKDLTPPVSTDGASITAWLNGVNGHAPLYNGFYQEWQALTTWLAANNCALGTRTFICGIGEQDSTDLNPDFAASLTTFVTRFRTDGVLTSTSKVLIAQKQRSQDTTIAAAQASYVNANSALATLAQMPSPTFLSDNTHYNQAAILRLGAIEYSLYAGAASGTTAPAGTVLATFDAPDSWNYDASWTQYVRTTNEVLGTSIYYTTSNNGVANRTLVVTQPAVLKFFQNRATGYGTGVVSLNGVQLGAAWSANGPNSGPDPVNAVYTSPVIQPGIYTLTVTNTILQADRVQIILDRSILYAA